MKLSMDSGKSLIAVFLALASASIAAGQHKGQWLVHPIKGTGYVVHTPRKHKSHHRVARRRVRHVRHTHRSRTS
ncbi:MAG TPA: hypothetical protein VG944_15430 [Fimbriimonas sp.]|nr:hypothetical protein [Fimbriimonas sp.]